MVMRYLVEVRSRMSAEGNEVPSGDDVNMSADSMQVLRGSGVNMSADENMVLSGSDVNMSADGNNKVLSGSAVQDECWR